MYVVSRLCCIKYSLYPPGQMMSILLLGGLTRKVKIAKHWRHLGSIVERYSFICYKLCPHSHGIGGWLDEKSRDCQCQTLAAFRQRSWSVLEEEWFEKDIC